MSRTDNRRARGDIPSPRVHRVGYSPSSRRRTLALDDHSHPPSTHDSPRPTDGSFPTLTEVKQHIDAYFTYVQPYKTNALFHRSTLLADLAANRLNPVLILALCTITERHFHPDSPHPQGSPRANLWLQQAMSALITSTEKCLDNVLIALLLARHCIHSGIHGSTWNLVALANRQATGIGLHREDAPGSSRSGDRDSETRRRAWWACYALDRMMATGLPEFTLCPPHRIRVGLPCRDEIWANDSACKGKVVVPKIQEVELDATAEDFVDVGLMGHSVRLVGIRYAIISAARAVREGENILQPWEAHSSAQLSLAKLAHFSTTLHPSYRLTPSIIHALGGTDQLGPLVMLHLWYEMFHLELFRMAVPGYTESLPARVAELAPHGWLEDMASRCLEHGKNMMRILVLIEQETKGGGWADNLDPKLPMLVYASVRIQLELGKAVEVDEELKQGFEIMMACVGRIARFYAINKPLLRETRRMIRAHGIDVADDDLADDALGSPPHPWYKRLKNIEAERSQEQAQREVQIPTSDPYQAMYDDPALSALFDMPDWLGGLLGMPLDYSTPPTPVQSHDFDPRGLDLLSPYS